MLHSLGELPHSHDVGSVIHVLLVVREGGGMGGQVGKVGVGVEGRGERRAEDNDTVCQENTCSQPVINAVWRKNLNGIPDLYSPLITLNCLSWLSA